MANGQPWQKLNTNTQKAILYQSILEQVSGTLGNTMQDTTALRMSVFTAALGDVRLALGQAFLPILYNVLPLLTMLMDWLYRALQVFAAFMTALFGGFKFGAGNPMQVGGIKSATDATDKQTQAVNNLGAAHDKTAKKAKAAGQASQASAKLGVAGFDEVNTLAQKTAKAGGAGAGAGGAGGVGKVPGVGGAKIPTPKIPSPDASGFSEGVNKMVEGFKKKLEPLKAFAKQVWGAISGFVKGIATQISTWWQQHGQKISQAWSNIWKIIQPVIMWFIGFVWDSIQGLIMGIVKFFEGLIDFFTGIFTGDWGLIWSGLVDMIVGVFMFFWNFMNLTILGGVKKIFVDIAEFGLKKVLTWILGMRTGFDDFMVRLVGGFFSFLGTLKNIIFSFGRWFIDNSVRIALDVIRGFERIGAVGRTIWNAIKGAFGDAVNWFSRSIITPLINNFDRIRDGFKHGITSGLTAVLNSIRGPINAVVGAFNGIKNTMHIPVGDIPQIHPFAQGGIVSKATLAMVGEGGGSEAIAPLDKLQGFITNAMMETLRATGGGGGGEIILNIDGRRFARIIKPYLDNEDKRIGTNVRLTTI